MKICAAQTRPVKGDVQSNIERHKKLLDIASSNGAEIVIFPELSITGYEPELARELATTADDNRFDDFQKISDDKQMIIGIGMPTKNDAGIFISMILFQPHDARRIYSKKHLHSSEDKFFTSGQNFPVLTVDETNIALAICYELFVPEHSENAHKNGAKIYMASVVESKSDIERAMKTLSEIAEKYSMTVLMANCVGRTGVYDCDGKTSVWNDKGLLRGQLSEKSEGIIIFDTETQETIEKSI